MNIACCCRFSVYQQSMKCMKLHWGVKSYQIHQNSTCHVIKTVLEQTRVSCISLLFCAPKGWTLFNLPSGLHKSPKSDQSCQFRMSESASFLKISPALLCFPPLPCMRKGPGGPSMQPAQGTAQENDLQWRNAKRLRLLKWLFGGFWWILLVLEMVLEGFFCNSAFEEWKSEN